MPQEANSGLHYTAVCRKRKHRGHILMSIEAVCASAVCLHKLHGVFGYIHAHGGRSTQSLSCGVVSCAPEPKHTPFRAAWPPCARTQVPWTGDVTYGIIESRMGSLPPEALLIVIVLVFAVATGLGVWLFFYATGKTKPKRRANPSTAATLEVAELSPHDGQELLRVSRTKAGALVVFLQGQHYHHLRGVTDPKAQQEAIDAINAAKAFGEGVLPAAQPTPSQAIPQSLIWGL